MTFQRTKSFNRLLRKLDKEKSKKGKKRTKKKRKKKRKSRGGQKKRHTVFNLPTKFMSSYAYFYQEKQPINAKNNPGLSFTEIVYLTAKQWQNLSKEEKQPYYKKMVEDRFDYEKEINKIEDRFFSSNSDYSDLEYLSISSDSDMSENEEKCYLEQIQEAHHKKIKENKTWIESKILRLKNEINNQLLQKNPQSSTEKKDIPNLPQRPKAAYMWYNLEIRKIIEEEHPKWSRAQINKEISRCWNDLPEEDKLKYYNLSIEDHKRYQKEREENTINIENNEYQIEKNNSENENLEIQNEKVSTGSTNDSNK
ncbi:high mobility group protein dsp1 [Anaeramoeba flamelloides]|uniref:High mobility group protein dsp1 n=1 Tax=Anaeramoeba flamelloides TaxID=1746091 RepID=A0ABQ8XST8_9EUKA|nr:high mobility group protein dsp1 [Anaeramoeba flamelloides]